MRFALVLLWLCLTPLAGFAQDTAPRDRGVLQAFLEDNLSDAGRVVKIDGFKGALSSRATIDSLSIADQGGVWLTMRGVVLDWSRAALLGGRLEIAELSAAGITLTRLPQQSGGGVNIPSAEATPFQLPDLPVSVDIAKISAARVTLGAAVLGEAAQVRVNGSLSLAGGAGKAALEIVRTDGRDGAFNLRAGYANDTDRLTLDLTLHEGAGGIASTLLSLPQRPELSLSIKGDAPLSDFTAEIALSSDGEDRLTGQVQIKTEADAAGSAPKRLFSGDLGGDIAPLFAPDMRPFFGPDMRLSFSGRRDAEGRLELSSLTLSAATLKLSGSLLLGADGLPERFDLTGRIAAAAPVLLPLPGVQTWVGSADIAARFDAAQNEHWEATANVARVRRGGLRLAHLQVAGNGTISRAGPQSVTADLTVSASGIKPTDAALAEALGDSLSGSASMAWIAGAPMQISALDMRGAGLHVTAQGQVGGLGDGVPLKGHFSLTSDDISRFSGLAGRPLAGGAVASVSGSGALLSGAFDIDLSADTTDLKIGVAPLDPLLAGGSQLRVIARRGAAGTVLERLALDNSAISARASGRLDAQTGELAVSARLADISRLARGLSGPATLRSGLSWAADSPLRLEHLSIEGAGAALTASGTLDLGDAAMPVTGTATLSIAGLAPFSGLAGRSLGGALVAHATGSGQIKGSDFDLKLDGRGQDLAAGLGDFDKLIAGTSDVSLSAARKNGQTTVTDFAFDTPQVSARLRGGVGAGEAVSFTAKLANLAVLAPDFPGSVSVQGTAEPQGDNWQLALDATGPGGSAAHVSGQVSRTGAHVALAASGTAPLGLVNGIIAPRSAQGTGRFDLRLDGVPALSSLSGNVETSGARIAAPTLGLSLSGLNASAVLAGGRATIAAGADVAGGGRVTVTGPVSLSPPFDATLEVRASNAAYQDPALFKTTVSGSVTLQGPLTGAAQVHGALDLGPTEVQVVPAAGGSDGAVPVGLIHLHDTANERATRVRAGLMAVPGASGGGSSPLGLDLTIRAPNRIFLRGRGLDAELGGQLRLTGTTADMVPVGRFDLIRGRLDILGKRLSLDEGLIRLQGAFDPYVRLVAATQTDTAAVQIVIEGTVSDPSVTFSSVPELPQDEVLAQLLFGHAAADLTPLQAAQLAGAVATLAGRSGGGIVAKLRDSFGLDNLDITSSDSGTAQLRIGKYLSQNVYTDVVVGSDGKSEINLNLDLSPKLTAKGSLNALGEPALGIFYERDY